MTPTGIKIEYTDENGEWKEVTPKGTWTYKGNQDVVYEHEPVTTSKIRITMTHAKNGTTKIAVAVKDWLLLGDVPDSFPKPTVNRRKIQVRISACRMQQSMQNQVHIILPHGKISTGSIILTLSRPVLVSVQILAGETGSRVPVRWHGYSMTGMNRSPQRHFRYTGMVQKQA